MQSLLFIPDISGFTEFVQTTEAAHSQHVIAELLKVMIDANTLGLTLAEIEGDALFFYKEGSIPSQEKILAQMETIFAAFYSHLKLLEKNRICPCKACASAPKLELKIIVHAGELQFLELGEKRKPFGISVIRVHRMLKNSVPSHNYVLISNELATIIGLVATYKSRLYNFKTGMDSYDGEEVTYQYSKIDKEELELTAFETPEFVNVEKKPQVTIKKEFPVKAAVLFELIANYKYRHHWAVGVDEIIYNEDEVTRIGTNHNCVINGKMLNITTITTKGAVGELVYGERPENQPIKGFVAFYFIKDLTGEKCSLTVKIYWDTSNFLKSLLLKLLAKKKVEKNFEVNLDNLHSWIEKGTIIK